MYLSLNWVKNWLKLPSALSPEQIALALTMSTVEVEELVDQAKNLQGIVVGKVMELTKHPQADLLQVVKVNLGDSQEQLVCGGTNLRQGMLVAVATVGSKVRWHGQGDLVELAPAKIRGVESRGMIVAAAEIGLSDLFPAASDKEIIDLSDLKVKVGQRLAQALDLDDIVIDIDNKSINHRPDLWGQYGLARELAAIYKVKLAEYKTEAISYQDKVKLRVDVQAKDDCFRYSSLVISGLRIAESPQWLKAKLVAVGIRPINNIVDVTNFVMYELGQPLHAFDAKQVEDYSIQVKLAKRGEKFNTLDGVKRQLNTATLMIADSKKYLAIAGIMGGQNSEISQETTEIILESANFKAATIRRASQFLGLRSESSSRFEKSLDPSMTGLALQRATQLILSLNPEASVVSNLVDINNNPFNPITLSVPETLIGERMGMSLPAKEIKDILTRLQFKVDYKKKVFTIAVPSFRATKDISIPEDIVEEVARIYGYDRLQTALPQVALQEPLYDLATDMERSLKTWLALAQGYNEIATYPFTDLAWVDILGLDLAKHIRVKNPLSPELSYLNLSLLPNLFNAAQSNYRWSENFRIFELERVFDKSQNSNYHTDNNHKRFLPQQYKHLTGVEVATVKPEAMYLSIKGLLESMFERWGVNFVLEPISLSYAAMATQIKSHDIILGYFGLLQKDLLTNANNKLSVGFWDLDFTTLVKYISQNKQYQLLPKYPSVNRDMAIIVDRSTGWQELSRAINKVSPLIKRLEPFDVYYGQELPTGKKSIAFHLEFRSDDRTLLTEDVDKLISEILAILKKKFGAAQR